MNNAIIDSDNNDNDDDSTSSSLSPTTVIDTTTKVVGDNLHNIVGRFFLMNDNARVLNKSRPIQYRFRVPSSFKILQEKQRKEDNTNIQLRLEALNRPFL